jgi:hypothetical protein
MTRRNWSKLNTRDRMRRYGSESVTGAPSASVLALLPKSRPMRERPPPLSREQVDVAIAAYKGPIRKTITCAHCGHRGVARIPPGHAMRFRCRQCGHRLSAGE